MEITYILIRQDSMDGPPLIRVSSIPLSEVPIGTFKCIKISVSNPDTLGA